MKRFPWQPKSSDIPTQAGVYRFISEVNNEEIVLYVGKAKNLRNRLNSYFQKSDLLLPRTLSMLNQSNKVVWTVVGSEVEALQLEHNLISVHKPRYNIRFRDDKSYPYLSVSVSDEIPRVFSTRKKSKNGYRYFGPYPNSSDVRVAIDSLLKVYPIRSCSNGVFMTHRRMDKPCLLGHIGKCIAPCVSSVDQTTHRQLVDSLIDFLDGQTSDLLTNLTKQMSTASSNENFEEAAKYRDQIKAITSILQKSAVDIERNIYADFIGYASNELDLVISIIRVKNGKVISEERVLADLVSNIGEEEVLTEYILTRYSVEIDLPNEIYIKMNDEIIQSTNLVLDGLTKKKISFFNPKRGEKLRIVNLAQMNAESALNIQNRGLLADLNSRSQALQSIATALNLTEVPLRIECVDVSHLQGSSRVAAVVVFEDGLPIKSEYRSYVLQTPGDDLAGIREVISRRIEKFKNWNGRYPLGLLVIDGGPWQAQAAMEILQKSNVNIPVVGLAKRLEELWLPAAKSPIMLPRDSLGLYLLQQIRDETHRRAISHHRNRRSKQAIKSVLEDIEGVGPERRKLLLKHFGGSVRLRNASLEEIAEIKGIGPQLAKDIFAELHISDLNLPESDNEVS